MKKTFLFLFFSLSVLILCGQEQGYADYYRRAEGLSGLELKSALHRVIQPDRVLSYGSGKGRTWSGFWFTDQQQEGRVLDRYSNEIRFMTDELSSVSGMHIEHIWANSWWGHEVNNAYCDLFNLFPADASANIRKSNHPIGIVDGTVAYDNGVIRVGKSTSYRADSLITVWEPADEWKGDFARTYFYMATCYSHLSAIWSTTEGLLTVDPVSPETMRPWVSRLMMEWAVADPLDDVERQRNEAIYRLQGNRNPFVDYPELCTYIWGEQVDRPFLTNEEDQTPRLFVPLSQDTLELWNIPLGTRLDTLLTVRGRFLDQDAQLHVTGDALSLDKSTILAAEMNVGTTVALHIGPRTETLSEGKVLLSIGDQIQCELVLRIHSQPAPTPIKPIFSVSPVQQFFVTVPDQPSPASSLSIYTKNVQSSVCTIATEAPFEVSLDALTWSQSVTTTYTNQGFYLRFGGSDTEGIYEGEVIVSCAGVDDKIVTATCDVDARKSFFENFESGSKGGYPPADVTCSAATWRMSNALISSSAKDPNALDGKCVRMQGATTKDGITTPGYIEMLSDTRNGCDSLWFQAGSYGTDTGVKISVFYSQDGGATWTPVVQGLTVGTMQRYGYRLGLQGDVRLRFENDGKGSKRVNLDNIQMSDYGIEDAIRALHSSLPLVPADALFDLSGRRPSFHQRGLIIRGGKKVLR